METTGGPVPVYKVHNPIEIVNAEYKARNDAQKIESMVLTTENVKRLSREVDELKRTISRVSDLEKILMGVREDMDRLKAGKKV